MRTAREAYRIAMENHNRKQIEYQTRMYPVQFAEVDKAIAAAITEGEPLVRLVVEWEMTERLRMNLTDLGYVISYRNLPEDKVEYIIDWATSNQRLC